MLKEEKKALELDITKGIPCSLNHGDRELPLAVDYITQGIGYTGKKVYEIVIPICKECVNHLTSPEHILLYCLKCNANIWLYKKLGRLDYYGKHVCWQSCCKDCCEPDEEVSVFFND